MSSYRKNSIKSKIDRVKPKKSILKKLWFWVSCFSVIVLIAIVYFLLFFSHIQVANINISGNQKVDTEEIKNVILKDINFNIISIGGWNVNSKSMLLVDEKKISKDILSRFFVVETVKIARKLPQSLEVLITERKPVGVFCEANNCFYIDQNGEIFEGVRTIQDGILIVRQSGKNLATIKEGDIVIERDIINKLSKIQENMKANFQINLVSALINESSRLNVVTENGWKIYFDLSSGSDINSQITKLNSLLGGGISDSSMNHLYYIDLRPNDRAIVCDNATCANN